MRVTLPTKSIWLSSLTQPQHLFNPLTLLGAKSTLKNVRNVFLSSDETVGRDTGVRRSIHNAVDSGPRLSTTEI